MYESLIGTLIILFIIPTTHTCPLPCVCKWKNGKQTVECINKGLLVVPEGMDTATQVFDAPGNNFRALHNSKFLRMDLINLQRIYLSRCHIFTIDNQTFKGLTNLVELDLSHNSLQVIPSAAFVYCPSLMRLTLNSNPVKALQRSVFSHLSSLSSLELSNCEISTVDEGAFQGLHSLEWLYLDGNKMSSFAATRNLPSGLKGVQLHNNPWECDCNILELHSWMLAFSFPFSVEPVCKGPSRLSGRTIKSVPYSDLACIADVSPTAFYLEIEEGRNISLLCQIHAVPEAEIAWSFEGQVLQNNTIMESETCLVYFIERGDIEKQSELFIYNANSGNNGTYICSAENPAGISQANYTIRVLLKDDDVVYTEEMPIEVVLFVASGLIAAGLLLLLVIILSVIKCQKQCNSRTQRIDKGISQRIPLNKTMSLLETMELSDDSTEMTHIKITENRNTNSLRRSNVQLNQKRLKFVATLETPREINSSPLETYQSERNPDLINGTEILRCIENEAFGATLSQFPHSMVQNIQRCGYVCTLSEDVRLSPVGLLNDRCETVAENCYTTLPYNRMKQKPVFPAQRLCTKTELACQPAVYDEYDVDIRYTADGYPAKKTDFDASSLCCSSPAASNKSEGSTSTVIGPCCSTGKSRWPQCMPGSLGKPESSIKKSVSSQTQTELNIGVVQDISNAKRGILSSISDDNVQL